MAIQLLVHILIRIKKKLKAVFLVVTNGLRNAILLLENIYN